MTRPDKNEFKFHEVFVVGGKRYKGQRDYDTEELIERVNSWWYNRGLGLPSHQMLLLNSSKILLGMPFLRRTKGGTWEGSTMKATLSKTVDRRDFKLGKAGNGQFSFNGEEFYTGVSLAKSSESKLSVRFSNPYEVTQIRVYEFKRYIFC